VHIERYLSDVADAGVVSEIAFYTPLVTHLLRGVLNYPSGHLLVNKKGEKGIPDIRVLSTRDRSEWIVCEAKIRDADIRDATRQQRIWQEQIVDKGYITAETIYVLLCAPHTLHVYDVHGVLVAGVELHPDTLELTDVKQQENLPLTDVELSAVLDLISAATSAELPQYQTFRDGELAGGYIPLEQDTLPHLRRVFEFALRDLKAYCEARFEQLKQEYAEAQAQRAEIAQQLELVGTDPQEIKRIRNQERAILRSYHLPIHLFETEYPQFKHDQAYAGTEREAHFEDIFLTNTAYIALTRLFFVRICEDIGLTTRKVSNEGLGVWSRFVRYIKQEYRDLLHVAYRDVSYVYSRLFEPTVFDWFGAGNGDLNAILERILFRLNAFSFAQVDRDLLGTIYQYFRPKAERKRLGEYYTPEEVVDYILARTGVTSDPGLMSKRLLDPACGSFTFGVRALLPLLHAGRHLSARNRVALVQKSVTGRDINPFSVFLSHLSLLFAMLDIYREAKEEDPMFAITGFDVANINSLVFENGQGGFAVEEVQRPEAIEGQSFDYVVGNPPFVRNERLPLEDRDILDGAFRDLRSGNTDLAAYFLDATLRFWLKDDGILGMVAPIGLANARNAAILRERLSGYTLYEIVSLEWMAKEIFPDADIIPMLLFIKKADAPPDHKVSVVTGLRTKAELTEAMDAGPVRTAHVSEIDYADWLALSPTGDWPLDVTARDIPILRKLSAGPRLETAADPTYGIKLGSAAARLARARDTQALRSGEVGFAKGQHICAFGISEPEEFIDLARIREASDPSLWRDLSFYEANQGRRNETGLNGTTFASNSLLVETLPSDTLCCLVPQVYPTLVAAATSPLGLAVNNSSMVVIPRQCSAHVLAAVINSRICRYYAFLTMRAAILLRRRSTWYPRALRNLPWPALDAPTALQLHLLAKEAAELSAGAQRTEAGIFLEAMKQISDKIAAGFLGVYMEGPQPTLEADDLAAAQPADNSLTVGTNTLHAPDADTLLLARTAALASDREEFDNHTLQNLALPAQETDRRRLAAEIRALAGSLEAGKSRMDAIAEESDLLIAGALGLTSAEHTVIRERCLEFPLDVTVGRPRYVWNPDRKTQARRIYAAGQRFR
jgi:hypothetical protein